MIFKSLATEKKTSIFLSDFSLILEPRVSGKCIFFEKNFDKKTVFHTMLAPFHLEG